MGVHGLMSFIERKELFEYVELADIAEEYRTNRRKTPTVLVDISSCICFLYTSKSRPLAAEIKKFRENCERFVNAFYDLNIELNIIGDGLKPDVNLNAWVERAKRGVTCNSSAYGSSNLQQGNPRCGFLYPIALEVFSSSPKCKFCRAVYDADDYIAQLLKDSGAFGVLSNDTDFIFMEGYDYLLSIRDFDVRKMRTSNLNRGKLARCLGIDVELLPFVGTLCPNNVLDMNDLEKFYRRNRINYSRRFADVARVVSRLSVNDRISKGSPNFQSVLYFDEHQLKKFEERLTSLSGGHQSAELKLTKNKNWDDILTFAKAVHCKGDSDKNFLELLLEQRIFLAVGMERVDITTPDEELQHLRRKIYEFLFSEYPKEITVAEHLFAFSPDSKKTDYCRRDVTFTRRNHMGLLKLWSSDAPEDVRKQRSRFFFEVINEKLDANTLLEKVQLQFLFPLLAAFYLHCELAKFERFEVDALLMHSVLANKLSSKEVAEYECRANFDALNLSGWFLKMINYLELLNVVCGNPFDRKETNLVNYFEGLLLHTVYEEMKNDVKIIDYSKIPKVVATYNSLKEVLNEMKQSCGFE